MTKIRIIARLDVKGPDVINTIRLEGLRKVGAPNELARSYYKNGADEILIIDQVASLYQRSHLSKLIKIFADEIFIPITVGGGLKSVEDARELLRSGGDKVAINTAATKRPKVITEISNEFGKQCVVGSIQAKKVTSNKWICFTDGGREPTKLDCLEWAQELEFLGAGEILVTSIDQDGTKKGFDYELMNQISKKVTVPVIASGGFGNVMDASNLLDGSHSDAIAIADYLHMNRGEISSIKDSLYINGYKVRRL